MPESSGIPNFGKIYHTADNKTVFIDPKTNQATIFEGILPIETLLEPFNTSIGPDLDNILSVLNAIPYNMSPLDSILSSTEAIFNPAQTFNSTKNFGAAGSEVLEGTDNPDILGPKNYYILASMKSIPLSVGTCPVRAWVSEFKKGHQPDYKGFHKHRILPEQWDWLGSHKTCPIVSWYDVSCPAFITLACLDHAQVVRPVLVPSSAALYATETKAPEFVIESNSVTSNVENILAEERDV